METVASQLWPMPALFVLSFPHLCPSEHHQREGPLSVVLSSQFPALALYPLARLIQSRA